ELAAKSAKRALDVLEMSCAAILFEMAEEVNDFGKTIGRDDISNEEKLKLLADLIERNQKIFGDEDEDFAEDLRDVVEINAGDEDELESEGNYVISRIYDYADANLIWLGFP
ncbi:MAG: hypothetical protein ACYTBS_11230, partial [Planctomycetota bacterium]